MSTITLPNIRVSSDLTVGLKLKDGGVAIDWSTLSNIRVSIYADAQRSLAGRCTVAIDETDSTVLVCQYAANKPQYLGVNRVIVQCTYMGETKTYDKPAFTFVRWTDDQEGEEITITDPDVDVEISVEDVSSSILQEAIDAALNAAADAEEAAHLVPLQVLEDCVEATGDANEAAAAANAAAGRAPYIGENGNWFVWDVETGAYVDSGEVSKGDTGDAAGFGTVTASAVEDGGDLGVVVATSGPDTAKNIAFTLKNFKGDKGDKGDQGNTGSSVDYPFELVNNETTDDATKAHTAAGAKRLKDELSQLDLKVSNLSGQYYGFYADSSELPDNITQPGYAFVGTEEPFAIYQFDGEEWSDTGAAIDSIQGEPGVGFDSVGSQQDGTIVITLSNGNTITVDLNHSHPDYYSKVVETTIPVGGMLPDVVYKLGTLTGDSISFSLSSAVSGNVNHYYFTFDTGSSAPVPSWPNGLTWASGSALSAFSANKHYEVSIMDGIVYYSEV